MKAKVGLSPGHGFPATRPFAKSLRRCLVQILLMTESRRLRGPVCSSGCHLEVSGDTCPCQKTLPQALFLRRSPSLRLSQRRDAGHQWVLPVNGVSGLHAPMRREPALAGELPGDRICASPVCVASRRVLLDISVGFGITGARGEGLAYMGISAHLAGESLHLSDRKLNFGHSLLACL